MTRDDDEGTRRPDEPEADATPEERARAVSLARHLDAMLAGAPAPPALEAEERDLLELATALHAGTGRAGLDAARRDRLLDEVFATAGARAAAANGPEARPDARSGAAIASLPARRRLGRAAPWVVAAASLAATAALALRLELAGEPGARGPAGRRLPATALSRPADPLVGRIARADAANARDRIDAIFADRMAGYRSLRLDPRGGAR